MTTHRTITQEKFELGIKSAICAYQIYNDRKCLSRIRRLAAKYCIDISREIATDAPELDNHFRHLSTCDEAILNGGAFSIPISTYNKLYPYQREGVFWIWSLYQKQMGGLLCDDMGLGKTVQVSAFLAGVFAGNNNHAQALIVSPVGMIQSWKIALENWAPSVEVLVIESSLSESQKTAKLESIKGSGGILLCTYGLVRTRVENLRTCEWTIVICDEGHELKNVSTKISSAMRQLPVSHLKLILTGTPVQNNLMELWSLVDFVTGGTVLGSRNEFKMEFEQPIVMGSSRRATELLMRDGHRQGKALRTMIAPYFLRRVKKEIFATPRSRPAASCFDVDSLVSAVSEMSIAKSTTDATLTSKFDYVLWCTLTEEQEELYRSYLQTDDVLGVMKKEKGPLHAITMLKKICTHPSLLHAEMSSLQEFVQKDLLARNEAESKMQDSEVLLQKSAKLKVLLSLCQTLHREGHKTLVFSQSVKMLNIIATVLSAHGVETCRIDGSVKSSTERQRIVDDFNAKNSHFSVCLISTRAGGVGLTITGANRVIIFDPAWNPSQDNQAIDRAYRIGQKRDVVVFRLISAGTIEDKMYRKQVHKDFLQRTATETEGCETRHFTREECRALFQFESSHNLETLDLLPNARCHPSELNTGVALNDMPFVAGVSNHSLLYDGKLDIPDPQFENIADSAADDFFQPNDDLESEDEVENEVSPSPILQREALEEDEEEGSHRSSSSSNDSFHSALDTLVDQLDHCILEGAELAEGAANSYPLSQLEQHLTTRVSHKLQACSPTDRTVFLQLLQAAQEAIGASNAVGALSHLLDALEIADDEPRVHAAILGVSAKIPRLKFLQPVN